MLLAACGSSVVADRGPLRPSGSVVIGESFTIASRVLGETRRIHVYAPPQPGRYPVLYLLDGGPQEDFHHISGLAQVASVNGSMRELIVVGIESGAARKRDMTVDPARFRRFVVDELRPAIQARFPTDGTGTLIGESLAGLFVVDTFLREPQAFDAFVAISPSLWWAEQALAKEAQALLAAHPAGARSLYLSIANEGSEMPEMQQGMDLLVAALSARPPSDLRWWYEPRPDETHGTIYHPAAAVALRRLYGTVATPDPAP